MAADRVIKVLVVCLMLDAVAAQRTICDARRFRDELTRVCAFQRRDLRYMPIPSQYYYERDAPTSGRAGRTKPASLKPLQLAYYQVNFYAAKVRRQREYSLHRKCCVNGCTRYDFAGVC